MRTALMLLCVALSGMAVTGIALPERAVAQAVFELEKEQTKLREWLSDKHADIGSDYKRAQLNLDARRHFDRALELNGENKKAWKGLGYKESRGAWVPDTLLPEKNGVEGAEYLEARKKPDASRDETLKKCAERCRKIVEAAQKAGNERAARILAIDWLYYEPDAAAARTLRGHEKDGEAWVPSFAKPWREAGRKIHADASMGEEIKEADPQEKDYGTKLYRRSGKWVTSRTTVSADRASLLHRAAEGTVQRSMDLLEITAAPFGDRSYHVTHLQSKAEFETLVVKINKIEGDEQKFTLGLSGTWTRDPWGYAVWSFSTAAADDMLCNTLAINVLGRARKGSTQSPPWVTVGFSYLVTSQVLGTTSTVRYTMKKAGTTASEHDVIPEFKNKSGSPEFLREVALYDITFKREIPLSVLIHTGVNDMSQGHAAKSFSLFEYFMAEHKDACLKWLKEGEVEPEKRISRIEECFGMKLLDLETAWREWVLAKY